MTDYTKPISGKLLFKALEGKDCIVMAANIRITHSARGIIPFLGHEEPRSFALAAAPIRWPGVSCASFRSPLIPVGPDGVEFPYAPISSRCQGKTNG